MLTAVGFRFLLRPRLLAVVPALLAVFSAPSGAQDFNGDGYADLAVGAASEDWGTTAIDSGAVHILYGSASGLTAAGSQFVTQATLGTPDNPESDDRFGEALAWGDFNNDGYDDLAVGVPGESVGTAGRAGAVHIFFGSSAGLTTAATQFITQDSIDVPDTSESGDAFGSSLAAGYFDGDAYQDLAVGTPGESLAASSAGAVIILHGSTSGLTGLGSQFWHQDSPGILDAGEASDGFGVSLAAGDFDGNGRSDLAIGVPFEGFVIRAVTFKNVGLVHVLLSDGSGLTATGNQVWTQDSVGIVDVREPWDRFGYSLAAGDFNANGFDDLAIGIFGEDIGDSTDAGAVAVLYGTTGGLGAASNAFWSQDSPGIAGSASEGDIFGVSLVAADFDNDGFSDLGIGALGENLNGSTNAGVVHALYGGPTGLTASGSQLWSQDSPSIEGSVEEEDRFGSSLGAGDFNGDGVMDLVVGVFGEAIGAVQVAGGINVIYGSASGLSSAGDQFWSQNSPGIADVAEFKDEFGKSLSR
jgi:FG-GAP repeat protein